MNPKEGECEKQLCLLKANCLLAEKAERQAESCSLPAATHNPHVVRGRHAAITATPLDLLLNRP